MILRTLTHSDIGFALSQITREGWVQSRAVFASIVEHDPAGGLIAEEHGRPVALLTTANFGSTGWIGHLIVLPDYRKIGLGTRMMHKAMEHLQKHGVSTIRIEADPPGMGIYQRLGFEEEHESLRFRLTRFNRPSPAVELQEKDLADVLAFDIKTTGEDRGRYLKILYKNSQQALVMRRDNRLTGYLLAMPTSDGVNLGPFLAEDPASAAALLDAAPEGVTTVGLPATNPAGLALLQERGFEQSPSSIRMYLGPHPGQETTGIYGIANGATG
jgi:ribosomal protein S18 acetylase RimI-like enzyme